MVNILMKVNSDIGDMIQMFPSNAWSVWILYAMNFLCSYAVSANIIIELRTLTMYCVFCVL